MDISDYGVQFIAGWEGKRNSLYDDGGPGKGNCTIGYGHLVHAGPCDGRASENPFKAGLTDLQCLDLFKQDLGWRVSDVNKLIHIPVSQLQFDMLVDLYFNAGEIDAVFNAVNTGGDVCAELMKIVHDGAGNVLGGLVRRRQAECVAFQEEAGVTQAQYDELKNDIGEILAQLGNLGSRLDKQNQEILIQNWLQANSRTDELKQRIQYEAVATKTQLP